MLMMIFMIKTITDFYACARWVITCIREWEKEAINRRKAIK